MLCWIDRCEIYWFFLNLQLHAHPKGSLFAMVQTDKVKYMFLIPFPQCSKDCTFTPWVLGLFIPSPSQSPGGHTARLLFSTHDFVFHIAILPTHVPIFGWVNQCSVPEGFATLARSNPTEGKVSLCQPEPGPGLEPPTLGSPVEHDQHWLWPTPCALGHWDAKCHIYTSATYISNN